MNEFIEKLIGKLEEKANQTWLVLAERNGYERAIEIVNQLAEEYKPKSEWQSIYDKVISLEYEYAENGNKDAVIDCIRLENLLQYFKEELQSAEEYKDNLSENLTDWIPCSEKLPPKPENNMLFENKPLELYLATVRGSDYAWRVFWNGEYFTDGWDKVNVIAWQELPKVYKSKEGES